MYINYFNHRLCLALAGCLTILLVSCSKEYEPIMCSSITASKISSDFTKSAMQMNDNVEIAFPNAEKELVSLSNGVTVERLDSFYIFQGDVILSQDQVSALMPTHMLQASLISDFVKYWPNSTVYYTYSSGFSGQYYVQSAISEWETKTGLQFVYGTGAGNYIEFQNNYSDGNYSDCLGMKGGKQIISLQINGYNNGTVIHEIGHSVGLFHEHCRSDRDDYIVINTSNIIPYYLSQFNKSNLADNVNYGPFDFNSVMLYSSNAFSMNGGYTITKLDGSAFIGQRDSLSTYDAAGVSAIYGPPYHKLVKTLIDSDYRYDATHEEWSETWEYKVCFYADRACTIPTQLVYPRRLKVKHTDVSVSYGVRDYYPSTYVEVAQAGSSYFPIGLAYISMHSDYGVDFGTEEYFELLY